MDDDDFVFASTTTCAKTRYKNYSIQYKDSNQKNIVTVCNIGEELITFTHKRGGGVYNLLDISLYIKDTVNDEYIGLCYCDPNLIISDNLLLQHNESENSNKQTISLFELSADAHTDLYQSLSISGLLIIQSFHDWVPFDNDSHPTVYLVDSKNEKLCAITPPPYWDISDQGMWLIGMIKLETMHEVGKVKMTLSRDDLFAPPPNNYQFVGDANVLKRYFSKSIFI